MKIDYNKLFFNIIMKGKVTFPETFLGDYTLMAKCILNESKNLKLFLEYFQNVAKEFDKFSKGLNKALMPIRQQIINLNKTSFDSWGYALKTIVGFNEECIRVLGGTSEKCNSDIIKPLGTFIVNYDNVNAQHTKECSKIVETLTLHKKKLNKLKLKYHKAYKRTSVDAEEDALKQSRKEIKEIKDKYLRQIDVVNAYIEKIKSNYIKELDYLQRNEEGRIDFIRNRFCSFYNGIQGLVNKYTDSYEGLKKAMEIVNPVGDLQHFMLILSKGQVENIFDKVNFEPFSEAVSSDGPKRREDLESDKESEGFYIAEDLKTFINDTWNKLLSSTKVETEEISQLTNMLKANTCRDYFFYSILRKVFKVSITDYSSFTKIKNLLNTVIKFELSEEVKENPGVKLSIVLNLFGSIDYVDEGGTITHLRDIISNNEIWNNTKVWQYILKSKFVKSLATLKVAKKEPSPRHKSDKSSSKEKKGENWEEIGKRATIYSDLSMIANELALMNVNPKLSRDLIINFSNKYKLGEDKLYQLIYDYESAIQLDRQKNPPLEQLLLNTRTKHKQILEKHQDNKALLAIKLSMEYIEDTKELRSLLTLSKLFYKKLKNRVYKQVVTLEKVIANSRCKVWLSLFPSLKLSSLQKEYLKIKEEKMKAFQVTNKQIEDKIRSDTSRSFHIYEESVRGSIMNVLRCYAIFNTELGYYQGMHFFIAILYLVCKDESTAFALFCIIAKRHRLEDIYKESMNLMKTYLFQAAKLLGIFLPKLHKHLLEEGLNLQHFCSPWLFTAFTFVLQQTNEPIIPSLLYKIFDKFLIVIFLYKSIGRI